MRWLVVTSRLRDHNRWPGCRRSQHRSSASWRHRKGAWSPLFITTAPPHKTSLLLSSFIGIPLDWVGFSPMSKPKTYLTTFPLLHTALWDLRTWPLPCGLLRRSGCHRGESRDGWCPLGALPARREESHHPRHTDPESGCRSHRHRGAELGWRLCRRWCHSDPAFLLKREGTKWWRGNGT